ncbi:Flp family type IVb pilin [Uliginosibacterium aquaticum]|uniref:Flp family type IVb pilin n=1 Tax=Uliginosibacterium aquaticum TaxID=2731212 RepID=A0ABX2IDP6_9RHOO|nr:Flp family type IVb pilin [Uliginosibacterium aquaticum]NSL54724.1 Flp family type IVb pilin [Uliginosibacterium aquaticum]
MKSATPSASSLCKDSPTGSSSSWAELLADESAATAIEYALMASLIAVVISASVVVLSGSVLAMWEMVAEKLDEVM